MIDQTPEFDELFERLRRSAFRTRFSLDARERDYLVAKGVETIREHADDFVSRRLTPAAPANDGRQTPFRGHPVFVAQHATATCCRSCLAKWHRLPAGRPLDRQDCDYIVSVIMERLRRVLART